MVTIVNEGDGPGSELMISDAGDRLSRAIAHLYNPWLIPPEYHSMPTLQQTVAEAFLAELASKKSLNKAKIDALRKLLAETKIKADDFVKIFTSEDGEVS
jgi:hypothetical protein